MLRPASVYTMNRGRFHHLVFSLRALLWVIAAFFAIGHPYDTAIWISWFGLLAIGAFLWNRHNWLSTVNQIFIVIDFILISVAIRLGGGLSSNIYILYGAEALFLTAYETLRYSAGGSIAVVLAYGLATGAWDSRLFWWRMATMGLFLLAAGGLGREYRTTRTRGRENQAKLQQLSQLRVLQDSIVQEQDMEVVMSRLLEESREMTRSDVAYFVRLDAAKRPHELFIQGLPKPTGIDLSIGAFPNQVRVIGSHDEADWEAPFHALLRNSGMRSLALVPLRQEDLLYGWMGLATIQGQETLEMQEFIIQSLADVISTQLRYQESQSVAAKRGQLLAILERVGRIVNRNLEMGQLSRSLHQAVAEVLEIDVFFVALRLPDDPHNFLMQYLWDDGEEYPPEVYAVEPDGLTGSVITTGEPLILNGEDRGGTLTGSNKEPLGMLFVPLIHEGRVLGAMSAQSYRIVYDPDHLEFLSAIASQASIAIRNAQMYQQTQEIALTDYLTGLGNSRRFNMVLQSAIEMTTEKRQPLSLLLIDSDSLKAINDQFGHRAGDLHLQRVAQAIRESIREDDLAFRYAGDEFVVILPKSSIQEAVQVGDRIRQEIEAHRFQWSDTVLLTSTISVGAASFRSGMTADMLFQAADRAMYLAKQSGKNQVAAAQ